MARGDFIEPLFEISVRTVFPRRYHESLAEVLSWPWLVALGLTVIAIFALKKVRMELDQGREKPHFYDMTRGYQTLYCTLWVLAFFSLFMFRFANFIL